MRTYVLLQFTCTGVAYSVVVFVYSLQDIYYNLQQRSHSLTLPSEDNNLIRENFFHRMLIRDIY